MLRARQVGWRPRGVQRPNTYSAHRRRHMLSFHVRIVGVRMHSCFNRLLNARDGSMPGERWQAGWQHPQAQCMGAGHGRWPRGVRGTFQDIPSELMCSELSSPPDIGCRSVRVSAGQCRRIAACAAPAAQAGGQGFNACAAEAGHGGSRGRAPLYNCRVAKTRPGGDSLPDALYARQLSLWPTMHGATGAGVCQPAAKEGFVPMQSRLCSDAADGCWHCNKGRAQASHGRQR